MSQHLFKGSAVQVGDTVQMRERIIDEGEVVAERRAVGDVVMKAPGGMWTVRFQRSGRICDVDPIEFDVLCDADFAARPDTTPGEPMKRFPRGARRTPCPMK